MKIGYKATYNFICRGHKFEIGQTYDLPNKPIMCEYGFHYCVNPKDVLEYYSIQHDFRLLEIEDLGESITEEDKTVTNKIRIVREVPKEEYYPLFGFINNKLIIIYEYGCWVRSEYDERNNRIYYEDSNGFWVKCEYDERNNRIYFLDSTGCCEKREFDERNNCIYYEYGSSFWNKYSYDDNNNCICTEQSNGLYIKRSYDENNNCIKVESNKI